MKSKSLTPATIALHADREVELNHGIAPPIEQSVTYFADDADDFAKKATDPLYDLMFGSGMGAISRVATGIENTQDLIGDFEQALATN